MMKRVKINETWYESKDFTVLSSGAILVHPLKIAFWKEQLSDYDEGKELPQNKETLKKNSTKRITKEEAFKMLQNKKVYAGEFTEQVQEKLFEIGYEWMNSKDKIAPHQFIITLTAFQDKGGLMTVPNVQEFIEREEEEITFSSILNLEIESEFRNGDFVYWETKLESGIIIFNRKMGDGCIDFHAELNLKSLKFNLDKYVGNAFPMTQLRLANPEEGVKLLKALKENGLRWNEKELKIEEILKVNDLVILWDNDRTEAVMGRLILISEEQKFPYKSNNNHIYEHAIKCNSLEQYIDFTEREKSNLTL